MPKYTNTRSTRSSRGGPSSATGTRPQRRSTTTASEAAPQPSPSIANKNSAARRSSRALAYLPQPPSSEPEPDTINDEEEEAPAAAPPPSSSSASDTDSSFGSDNSTSSSSGMDEDEEMEQQEDLAVQPLAEEMEEAGDVGLEAYQAGLAAELAQAYAGDEDELNMAGVEDAVPFLHHEEENAVLPVPPIMLERELSDFSNGMDVPEIVTTRYSYWRNLPTDEERQNYIAFHVICILSLMQMGPPALTWTPSNTLKTLTGKIAKYIIISTTLFDHVSSRTILPLFMEVLKRIDHPSWTEVTSNPASRRRFEELVSAKYSDAKHALVVALADTSSPLDVFIASFLGHSRFTPNVVQATIAASYRVVAAALGEGFTGPRFWQQLDGEWNTLSVSAAEDGATTAARIYERMHDTYYVHAAARAPAFPQWATRATLPQDVITVLASIREVKPGQLFRW